jgi:hypothetical protein
MRGLNRVLSFDRERGTLEVEAGVLPMIFWPKAFSPVTARSQRKCRWEGSVI